MLSSLECLLFFSPQGILPNIYFLFLWSVSFWCRVQWFKYVFCMYSFLLMPFLFFLHLYLIIVLFPFLFSLSFTVFAIIFITISFFFFHFKCFWNIRLEFLFLVWFPRRKPWEEDSGETVYLKDGRNTWGGMMEVSEAKEGNRQLSVLSIISFWVTRA